MPIPASRRRATQTRAEQGSAHTQDKGTHVVYSPRQALPTAWEHLQVRLQLCRWQPQPARPQQRLARLVSPATVSTARVRSSVLRRVTTLLT